MLFFGCHHVVYLQGLRAGTLRIAEDMELRHVQALDKLISLPEILLRLSTGTHNHVYPYKGIGHHFLYLLYLRGKQGGIVTASHQLQHLVTARLQRYMEMRHETPGTGHVFYDFICQQIRLDGGYAVTLNAFHLVQRLHQVEESLTGRLAEVSDIDAGQYNFLSTFGSRLAGLLHHRSNAAVTATSAGKGNGAIGTIIIATILYFQKIASTISP